MGAVDSPTLLFDVHMTNVVLLLPPTLDGLGLRLVAGQFIEACGGVLPQVVTIDFVRLGFVKPSGVTFLSNFVNWLNVRNVTVVFANYRRLGDAIRFLDDSLFFLQHTGSKLNVYASPRSTTIPLQKVGSAASHSWLRSDFVPWVASKIGTNIASIHPLQVCISEMFNNIQDHTDLDVGSIFIQFFPKRREICIALADFGRGIPVAVRTRKPYLNDRDAILQAVQPGFTTQSTMRNSGIGLDYLLQNVVAMNGGAVGIFSLHGHVTFTRGDQGGIASHSIPSVGFCPGTTIDICLKTDAIVRVMDELEDMEW